MLGSLWPPVKSCDTMHGPSPSSVIFGSASSLSPLRPCAWSGQLQLHWWLWLRFPHCCSICKESQSHPCSFTFTLGDTSPSLKIPGSIPKSLDPELAGPWTLGLSTHSIHTVLS